MAFGRELSFWQLTGTELMFSYFYYNSKLPYLNVGGQFSQLIRISLRFRLFPAHPSLYHLCALNSIQHIYSETCWDAVCCIVCVFPHPPRHWLSGLVTSGHPNTLRGACHPPGGQQQRGYVVTAPLHCRGCGRLSCCWGLGQWVLRVRSSLARGDGSSPNICCRDMV